MRTTTLRLIISGTVLSAFGCLDTGGTDPVKDAGPVAVSILEGNVQFIGAQTALDREGILSTRDARRAVAAANAPTSIADPGPAALSPTARHPDVFDVVEGTLNDLPPAPRRALDWMPGQLIVTFEQYAYNRDTIAEATLRMALDAGFDDVSIAKTRCVDDRFCKVEVEDAAGKRLNKTRTRALEQGLKTHYAPGVIVVAANFMKYASRVPNDPYYIHQWHYESAGLPAAWDITTGDDNMVVAVIDSGIVLSHSDLSGRLVPGMDLVSDEGISGDGNGIDTDPSDPGTGAAPFHGTHVAGTVGAETNNAEGVAGVMWKGYVQPVRVLGTGGGTDFDILSGFYWAVGAQLDDVPINNTPARVLNASLGGPASPEAFTEWANLLDPLTQTPDYNNPIIVVAAGNEDQDVGNTLPGGLANMITVGSYRIDGDRSSFSNWGNGIDIMAPGGQSNLDQNADTLPDGVLSTFGNEYEFEQGTSMAAPHVAGVAALILSLDPGYTQNTIQALLRQTANPGGICAEGCGSGRMDPVAALLSSGGVAQAAPTLALDRTRLVFKPEDTTLEAAVVNIGDADLEFEVDVVGTQAELFSADVTSGTVPGQSYQTLTITLNRQGFAAGSANLHIVGAGEATGQDAYVDLIFDDASVPLPTAISVVRVAAYEQSGNKLVQVGKEALAIAAGDFEYKVSELPPGDYYVYGVGDDNNDGIFDSETESFGGWPNAENAEPIKVEAQTTYTGINFALRKSFVVVADGMVGSPCNTNAECVFADDAICITDEAGTPQGDELWPSGYCGRICTDDGYCGPGASCEVLTCTDENGQPVGCGVCLATCTSDTLCRQGDGYRCDTYGTCTHINFE